MELVMEMDGSKREYVRFSVHSVKCGQCVALLKTFEL
jgi:hypothetical protein